jgi:hypothetical protein
MKEAITLACWTHQGLVVRHEIGRTDFTLFKDAAFFLLFQFFILFFHFFSKSFPESL